jgi:hypothetical protein
MKNTIMLWFIICEVFWLIVTIACAIAGFFLARMLKRRSKAAGRDVLGC